MGKKGETELFQELARGNAVVQRTPGTWGWIPNKSHLNNGTETWQPQPYSAPSLSQPLGIQDLPLLHLSWPEGLGDLTGSSGGKQLEAEWG